MKTVTAECNPDGYLRYGRISLELDDEEYEKFCNLSESEQEEWLRESGIFEVTDYELNDKGDIYDIKL